MITMKIPVCRASISPNINTSWICHIYALHWFGRRRMFAPMTNSNIVLRELWTGILRKGVAPMVPDAIQW